MLKYSDFKSNKIKQPSSENIILSFFKYLIKLIKQKNSLIIKNFLIKKFLRFIIFTLELIFFNSEIFDVLVIRIILNLFTKKLV